MSLITARKLVLFSAFLSACTGHPPSKTANAAVAPTVVPDTLAPVGSEANPVRSAGPGGEREYLGRLRCRDGSAPWFNRVGSVGTGPYGTVLDLYSVGCGSLDSAQVAYFDMYHDYREARSLPGFAIVAAGAPEPSHRRQRPSPGCPPRDIPRDSVGPVAFEFQVDVVAESLGPTEPPSVPGVTGQTLVQFVVDTAGRPELSTYKLLEGNSQKLANATRVFVEGLHFRPAEHPVGCKVRQLVQHPFIFR